jgi:hypothetical protein
MKSNKKIKECCCNMLRKIEVQQERMQSLEITYKNTKAPSFKMSFEISNINEQCSLISV